MENTYKIVERLVREFWKKHNYEDDLLISFEQKYSFDTSWEKITTIASPYYEDGTGGEPVVVFNFDFCEGETELRKFMCLYLDDAVQILHNIIEERRRENEQEEI